MDIFIFRYEKILSLRQDEEEQCRNALALQLRDLHELIVRRDDLYGKLEAFNETLALQVSDGCTVQLLRTAESERKWLLEAIENQLFLIDLKEKDITAARVRLGEASKKRKIMEKLKENEYIQFQKEAELAEELATDQIVTFSSAKKQNG